MRPTAKSARTAERSSGGIRPCSVPTATARRRRRDARRRLPRRGHLALALFDRRHDDVRALSGPHPLGGERVDARARLGSPHAGRDRAAPGRLLVEHRDVELAVDGPGERARDRRRRHDEDVRALSLAEEPGAVRHAEPMLLVDDHEGEPAEPDRRLDERVRADEDVHLARAREPARSACRGLAPHAARQERQAHAGGAEPGGEARRRAARPGSPSAP